MVWTVAPEKAPVAAPFDRSYWVVPGRLLAGAYPGDPKELKASEKLEALHGAGIRQLRLAHGGGCRLAASSPPYPYAVHFLDQLARRR
jgi:hypothetical protein